MLGGAGFISRCDRHSLLHVVRVSDIAWQRFCESLFALVCGVHQAAPMPRFGRLAPETTIHPRAPQGSDSMLMAVDCEHKDCMKQTGECCYVESSLL